MHHINAPTTAAAGSAVTWGRSRMQRVVCMCVWAPWFTKSTCEKTAGIFPVLAWLDFFISNHGKWKLKGDDGILIDLKQLVHMRNKCKEYSRCCVWLRKVAATELQRLCDVVLMVPFHFLWFPSELFFPVFTSTLNVHILFLMCWSNNPLTSLFCPPKSLWSWTQSFSVSGNEEFWFKSSDLVPRLQGVLLGQTEHHQSVSPPCKVGQHNLIENLWSYLIWYGMKSFPTEDVRLC